MDKQSTLHTVMTTPEVAARFDELAQQEKWFEIQDELFADNVRSVEPAHSPYFKDATGKASVRRKGEEWGAKVEAVHLLSTTNPIVSDHHFAIGRVVDITVQGFGRIRIDEIMMYEVKDGRIVLEQFFY